MSKLIFEKSYPGRRAFKFPKLDVPAKNLENHIPDKLFRHTPPALPEISELDLVRHYTTLSQKNICVDSAFYPLGSCTMKYNPKINERIAAFEEFASLHPYVNPAHCQGMLALMYETEKLLCEICGMAEFTLQPAAGAHGELTGLLMIRAYHKFIGGARTKILVPDSAHGTNPASAAAAGFQTVEIKSDSRGMVDVDELRLIIDSETAALMLTCPNTLGIFEKDILQIADIVHKKGGLLYCDGANLNALMGIARPGDMGFDVIHVNLHKSFSTPHGGGGPGSGPVGVCEKLKRFLPLPKIEKKEDRYIFSDDLPLTIGKVRSFYGNIGVVVRALAYIRALGKEGLKNVSRYAVLNANYLLKLLQEKFDIPFYESVMHEFVVSARRHKMRGVKAVDIAKALLDKGFHPPTVYFPLIVEEALMIEPTETESKQTIDAFAQALLEIDQESIAEREKLINAPQKQVVCRLDEVAAARKPDLAWKSVEDQKNNKTDHSDHNN
ncbi:MAG: aminomethyl-transferring glycine dehydrogenase subunit GcvPB [bacterium]